MSESLKRVPIARSARVRSLAGASGSGKIIPATVLVGLLLVLAGSLPGSGGTQKNPPAQAVLPAELAWVPSDAACFVHIRNGDIKAGKHILLLNALLLEFGHPVGQALHRQIDISGEEVESITIVFPTVPNLANFISHFPRGEQLFQYYFDRAEPKEKGGKERRRIPG